MISRPTLSPPPPVEVDRGGGASSLPTIERPEAERPIEVISTEEGLAALAGTWEALLSKSASSNPFLRWEWISAWFRHFGRGKGLQILLVREEGRPIGIAPFYRTTTRLLGAPFRRLSFLGDEAVGSDHLDLISERGFEEKVARAVAAWLLSARRKWDWIALRNCSEGSPHLPCLIEALRENRWAVERSPGESCPYLALGATWDDYLNRLGAGMRYTVRRKIRGLEKEGSVEFVVVETPEEGDAAFETLIDLHQKRWDGRGGSDAFVSEVKSRFHREVAHSFFEKKIARIFLLKIDGKTVASLYGFLEGKRFFYYQAGFDPALRRRSVGTALMAKSLQKAISRGWEEFDFLRGDEGYKFHWTEARRTLWNVSLFAPGIQGAFYRGLFAARRGMKRSLKKVWGGPGAQPQKAGFLGTPPTGQRPGAGSRIPDTGKNINALRRRPTSGPSPYRRWVKSSLAGAAYYGGFLDFYLRVRDRCPARRRLFILGYHAVVEEARRSVDQGMSPPQLISKSVFQKEVEQIATRFDFLSIDQAIDFLEGKHLLRRESVVLTFDDGYQGVYDHAYPILKRLGIPAALYVCPDYVGTDRLFPHDRIFYLVRETALRGIPLRAILEEAFHPFPEGIEGSLASPPAATRFLLETVPPDRLALGIKNLQEKLGVADRAFPSDAAIFSWEAVEEMARGGMTIGSHTRRHLLLTKVTPGVVLEELRLSKEILEGRLGRRIDHLAYPDGRFDSSIREAARRCGYRSACATANEVNRVGGDPYRLGRALLWENSAWGAFSKCSKALVVAQVKGLFSPPQKAG